MNTMSDTPLPDDVGYIINLKGLNDMKAYKNSKQFAKIGVESVDIQNISEKLLLNIQMKQI